MFKGIETWSQKKLKGFNILFNVIYFLLTFIAPLTVVIVSFYSIGKINNVVKKTSILFIIISACIVLAIARFFNKQIDKIKILNVDGTYNRGMQITKHLLELVGRIIVPTVVLVLSIIFATALKDFVDFYNKMIIASVSFLLAGIAVDKLFISFIDDELEIRDKVADQNAINIRSGLN